MHTPITTARAAKTPMKHIPLKQDLNKVVLLLSYHYGLDYSSQKLQILCPMFGQMIFISKKSLHYLTCYLTAHYIEHNLDIHLWVLYR